MPELSQDLQDYLLPFVEDGTLILIGATTENPYFEVNGALISRSLIFELRPLEKEDIKTLLKRAVYDKQKGMGSFDAEIEDKIFAEDISIKLSVEKSKSDEFINVENEKIGISAKIDVVENSYR